MPDEIERLAEKVYKHIKDDLEECTTAACMRAKAEAEAIYNKVIKEGDLESLKELRAYRQDIHKLLEELEKARSEPVMEIEGCPSCKYDKFDTPPKVVGKCVNGCTKINEYEKSLGFKHCPICGDDIEYD